MKTLIDIDEDLMAAAAVELGTTTKKDTVNEALRIIAERRQRVQALIEGGDDLASTLGVGADITNPEVMRQARR